MSLYQSHIEPDGYGNADIVWEPVNDNAKNRNMMADVGRDLLGEQCPNCGGIKITDTTPNWVYDEKDICCCEEME